MNIEDIMQKIQAREPLTAEEKDFLRGGAASPRVLNPGQYGFSQPTDPQLSEQQYTPEEINQVMGLSANEEKQAAMEKQFAQADALRGAQMSPLGRIQMSSGTSYVPPNSMGEVIGTGLQNLAGAYRQRRLADREKKLIKKQDAGRKVWGERVMNPRKEEVRSDWVTPLREGEEETIWDKLRRMGGQY